MSSKRSTCLCNESTYPDMSSLYMMPSSMTPSRESFTDGKGNVYISHVINYNIDRVVVNQSVVNTKKKKSVTPAIENKPKPKPKAQAKSQPKSKF